MTFLFTLLIEPLELVFETIYVVAERIISNPGMSIVALSLAMNFLVLPLYRRADQLQAEEQELEKRLNPSITHIKKTFKGEEKFLMLQEFYRQNNYKPTYALRGSLSLLLEVPFFIAAYRFLSELELIKGVSFGPIKDLGAEDALIVIGSLSINLLPILMTLINIISGAIYTKGMPLKSKIQLNAMALIFLFFLYKSPAGLVFYWTLNNVFSLIKNIFYKLKNPAYVLKWLAAVCGAAFVVVFAFIYPHEFLKRRCFFIAFGLVLIAPLVMELVWKRRKTDDVTENAEKSVAESTEANESAQGTKSRTGRLFLVSVIALALITGVVIPGSVIKSSPSEFVEVSDFKSPLYYILKSAALSFGLFVIWIGIFYKLASPNGRKVFAYVASAVAICSVFNYMVYGKAKSNISSLLQYDNEPVFSISKQIINFLVIGLIFALAYFAFKKFELQYVNLNTVIMLAFLVMSIVYICNIAYVFSGLTYIKEQSERIRSSDDNSIINLSKNGKNVIVVMMDRAVGAYIPFIMEEKPELKESFDGFTFYHNTIAYGRTTNFGSPALYGGYEYTPKEMNARKKEKLEKKHNEALKVMPVTFFENNYKVTVCEPPLAGYKWIPDLSIYKDYPEINTYLTNKRLNVFASDNANEAYENIRMRNFFCLGVTKIAPLVLQETLYNGGKYNEAHEGGGSVMNPVQVRESVSKSTGIDAEFMNAYSVLDHLDELTGIR
ncbi:MAG: YidC/Oxa1 family membrane protein insertase, partial [Lachnospiraceae bacterium]|nr:YidC/Oxa1 family membrane protein insertase [Lachnospiraceae bacterium]